MLVTIAGNGKYGSKKVQFSSGKSWFMKPVKELEGSEELEVGKKVNIKFEKRENKNGKEVTFITEILDGSAPVETKKVVEEKTKEDPKPSKEYWEKKDQRHQDGQARGNYRSCLTNYFCSLGGKDVDVNYFNTILKKGEAEYFGDKVTEEVTPKVTETKPEEKKEEKKETDPYSNF